MTHLHRGVVVATAMVAVLAGLMLIGLYTDYHSALNVGARWLFGAWLFPVEVLWDFTLPLVGYSFPSPYEVPHFIVASWFAYTAIVGFGIGWCISVRRKRFRNEK